MSGHDPVQAAIEAFGKTIAAFSPEEADANYEERWRAAWTSAVNAAIEADGDSRHDFAHEILANAGPEWDAPMVPETLAVEYVRHLEHRAAGRGALLAEILGSFTAFGRNGQFRRCALGEEEFTGWQKRAELGDSPDANGGAS